MNILCRGWPVPSNMDVDGDIVFPEPKPKEPESEDKWNKLQNKEYENLGDWGSKLTVTSFPKMRDKKGLSVPERKDE